MSRVLPILFNTDMVRAILDGRKTVTRRVIKNPPHSDMPDNHNYCRMPLWMQIGKDEWDFRTLHYMDVIEKEPFMQTRYFESLAPFDKGDILYVRETWGVMRAKRFDACVDITFKAGGENKRIFFPNGGTDSANRDEYDEFIKKWNITSTFSWHPSIHMPKKAARIWLKVTDVRAERLQNMWASDTSKEGLLFTRPYTAEEMLIEFSKLWDSTIPKSKINLYGWDADPWVWVIDFERCEKPEEL